MSTKMNFTNWHACNSWILCECCIADWFVNGIKITHLRILVVITIAFLRAKVQFVAAATTNLHIYGQKTTIQETMYWNEVANSYLQSSVSMWYGSAQSAPLWVLEKGVDQESGRASAMLAASQMQASILS